MLDMSEAPALAEKDLKEEDEEQDEFEVAQDDDDEDDSEARGSGDDGFYFDNPHFKDGSIVGSGLADSSL